MQTWQLQTAKARLSELIDEAEKNGPQIITRRGVETVVVLPVDEWCATRPATNRRLLEILQSGSQFDLPIPPRGRYQRRKPPVL